MTTAMTKFVLLDYMKIVLWCGKTLLGVVNFKEKRVSLTFFD